MEGLDQIQLSFSSSSLWALNSVLALLMFGIALTLHPRDFVQVLANPKAAMVGLFCQFFLLPAATFLLIQVLRPQASVAMGMMLVAACPGGNVSNLIVYLSGGNAALSVGMTAVSSLAATVLTPLNFSFWASRDAETREMLTSFAVGAKPILLTVTLLLAVPMILGMATGMRFPVFAKKAQKPLRRLCGAIFSVFIILAVAKNYSNLSAQLLPVLLLVVLHNAMALSLGFGVSLLARLPARDLRTVTIEVGIQNSGLALGIIFSVFHGLGGMALIAVLWGIWHIVAGSLLATLWTRLAPLEAA